MNLGFLNGSSLVPGVVASSTGEMVMQRYQVTSYH